ncbi:hypothetical protein [Streptomyces sp. NPDC048272]|uniref:hypothetical protein n=1 Tax=Streptomyces sp. NPDC048272 TaxID=3154616 RepID=UPI003448D620
MLHLRRLRPPFRTRSRERAGVPDPFATLARLPTYARQGDASEAAPDTSAPRELTSDEMAEADVRRALLISLGEYASYLTPARGCRP